MGAYGHRRWYAFAAVAATAGTVAATALLAAPASASSIQAVADQPTEGSSQFVVEASSHVATGNVFDNDRGADGQPASVANAVLVKVDQPATGRGSTSFTPDGSVTYTPAACVTGEITVGYTIAAVESPTDTATATVTFRVDPENTPLRASPDTARMHGGTATVDVLKNDCGANGAMVDPSQVTASVVTPPAHGTASIGADGTVTYTADKGSHAADTLTYKIANANGWDSTADVSITPGPADLAVSITAPTGIDLGVAGTSTVTVQNKGDSSPVDPITLRLVVPKFVVLENAPVSCTAAKPAGTFTCPLHAADLAPDHSVRLDFAVEVDQDTPLDTVVHAITATVTTTDDADESNNTASTGDLGTVVNSGLTPPPSSPAAPTPPAAGDTGGLPDQPRGELANTGVPYVLEMTTTGVVLVVVGVAFVLAAARRRGTPTPPADPTA